MGQVSRESARVVCPKESEQGSRVFAFIHSPPGDYFPGKMEKCEPYRNK